MTFGSFSYLVFLPLVYLTFYFTRDRLRWLVLLVASYGFYATLQAPQLLLALALVTALSFACGIGIGRTADDNRRKLIFWLGTVVCLLVLAVMRYLPRLATLFAVDADANLLTSIGVSFFTFQAISYLADVYLEIEEPERHPGYHALSLAFFPKLLQGPIERAGDLLPQLKKKYEFDYEAICSGMLLFTLGLFKKVVLANRLALYPNMVYNDVHAYTGLTFVIATYVYALQLYFDFAGYTDMARGTARMFGINLTENFNRPYLATSIADFWRRWHISFSRWILDYIFKPLQLAWRDHGQTGTALALLVTFLVSGIWHGASWGFVIWGLLHGVYLAASTFYRPYQRKLHKWLGVENSSWLKVWRVFVTFNLVCFAWIFFRAGSTGDAWYVINNVLHFSWGEIRETFLLHNQGNLLVAAFCTAVLATMAVSPKMAERIKSLFECRMRWLFYYVCVMFILVCGKFGEGGFIYGRF